MSSSTSNLDLVIQSQASKEITINDALNAASPATLFARRGSQCAGLNWYYYGGVMLVDGVLTSISNNSSAIALTPSTTNYIEATRAGVVTARTGSFTPGSIPLYTAVTLATSVQTYTDQRAWVQPEYITGKATASLASADWTLSAQDVRCNYYTATGAIGVNRNVVVPNDWFGIFYNNTSGAFTVTVKTSGGSGVVVATGKRAVLFADGTNVVRVTADV